MNKPGQPDCLGRILVLLLCVLAGIGRLEAAGIQFYVAPNGNDSWSGRQPEPGLLRRDGPFRSLHRAREAVRAIRAGTDDPAGEIVILLRAGTYSLTEPFRLDGRDSGRPRGHTIYQAYPDEDVHITGLLPITGWIPCYNGTFRADLSQIDFGLLPLRTLYFEGRRQAPARIPNADPSHPYSGGFLYVRGIAGPPAAPILRVDGSRLDPTRWRTPAGARVRIWTGDAREEIIPLGNTNRQPGSLKLACAPQHDLAVGDRFYVENVFEELDAPGEWYYNPETSQLYFHPPDGRNPEGKVGIPLVSHLLEFSATPGKPGDIPACIRFAGIRFSGAGDSLVVFAQAEQCEIGDSFLENCDGDAVVIRPEATRIRVVHCEITAVGRAAIAVRGAPYRPEAPPPVSRRNILTENHIFASGTTEPTAAAIRIGDRTRKEPSAGNVISHNLIHDVPAAGIEIYGFRTTCDYNHLHHLNRAAARRGAIDIDAPPGEAPAGVVRFNLIHDTGGYSRRRPGAWAFPAATDGIRVHPDTPPLEITGNCIWGAPEACIRLDGPDHRIHNNLLYGHSRALVQWTGAPGRNKLDHNVFVTTAAKSFWLKFAGDASPDSDWNLLWAGENDPLAGAISPQTPKPAAAPRTGAVGCRRISWDQWTQGGRDPHSAVADPLLQSPETGDFHIAPRSLALKLGFVPIPFNRIGLTLPQERHPWPLSPAPIRERYLLHPGAGRLTPLPQ